MRTQQKNTRLKGEKILCVSGKRNSRRGLEEKTNLETNYWSPPIRKRDKHMKKHNKENAEKDSDTHRQETEESTGREKVGEWAIRKKRTQEEIATKPKIAVEKDTKEKVEQRNIKIRNTFSVLQEEDQEPILEEEELPPIIKIDKDEKKVIDGREWGSLGKYLNEKRKKWNDTQSRTTKTIHQCRDPNQEERSDKMQKCDELYKYKTTECL